MKSLGSVRWVFVRHLLWCITFGYYLFLEIYFFFYVVLPWFGDKYNVIMYAKRQVRWMLKEIWFGISPALLFLRHASCPCPETPECTMYSFVSFDSIMLWNLIRLHDIRRNHLTSWVTLLKVKALSLLFNSPCYVLEIWLSRNSSSSLYMALHTCTLYNALQFTYSYTTCILQDVYGDEIQLHSLFYMEMYMYIVVYRFYTKSISISVLCSL